MKQILLSLITLTIVSSLLCTLFLLPSLYSKTFQKSFLHTPVNWNKKQIKQYFKQYFIATTLAYTLLSSLLLLGELVPTEKYQLIQIILAAVIGKIFVLYFSLGYTQNSYTTTNPQTKAQKYILITVSILQYCTFLTIYFALIVFLNI